MAGQRSNFRKFYDFSTLRVHISKTIHRSGKKPSPACSPFNSAQNEVFWCISIEYLGRIVLIDDAVSHRWRHRSNLWRHGSVTRHAHMIGICIYHGNINGKKPFKASNRIHHLKKRLWSQIMWFEVNVRLSEVTELKWPHETEWQCGNSTLAMSWPNHVQISAFAPMESRQGAVKHGFVSKIAGGCSSYDVIAPWTRKLRKIATSGKRRWIGRRQFYIKYFDHFFWSGQIWGHRGSKKVKLSQNRSIFTESRNYVNNYTS